MKFISPTLHGVLDYLLFAVFLVLPSVYVLTGPYMAVCYVLATGYLLVTLCTQMPFGLFGLIPFWVRGGIDLVSGLIFIASPWIFDFAHANGAMRNLFIGLGVVILIICLFTRWKALPGEEIKAATE